MAEGITPLSGLELRRRVCELIGERVGRCGQCGQDYRTFSCGPSHAIMFNAQAPMYESDASLSEALLVKICDERGWQWWLHRVDGIYNCVIEDLSKDDFPEADGKDPSEARCRAIVEALSR